MLVKYRNKPKTISLKKLFEKLPVGPPVGPFKINPLDNGHDSIVVWKRNNDRVVGLVYKGPYTLDSYLNRGVHFFECRKLYTWRFRGFLYDYRIRISLNTVRLEYPLTPSPVEFYIPDGFNDWGYMSRVEYAGQAINRKLGYEPT